MQGLPKAVFRGCMVFLPHRYGDEFTQPKSWTFAEPVQWYPHLCQSYLKNNSCSTLRRSRRERRRTRTTPPLARTARTGRRTGKTRRRRRRPSKGYVCPNHIKSYASTRCEVTEQRFWDHDSNQSLISKEDKKTKYHQYLCDTFSRLFYLICFLLDSQDVFRS